jgi:hypothetical protein
VEFVLVECPGNNSQPDIAVGSDSPGVSVVAIDLGHEFSQFDPKPGRDFLRILDRDVDLATLNLAHIRAIDIRDCGKFFLGVVALWTEHTSRLSMSTASVTISVAAASS